MRIDDDDLQLAATDLSNHLACGHLTQLDRRAAAGEIPRPAMFHDPRRELLAERGEEHERQYLEHLRGQGLEVVEIAGDGGETLAAMLRGVDVIAQARLGSGRWRGRADVLGKVAGASGLGAWKYEVLDTKLAQETRGGTILQLCVYSELLGAVQGALPERMGVVVPGRDFVAEHYRVAEYLAYHRRVKRRLERAVAEPGGSPTYPLPCEHCAVCRWWQECDRRWRADDHLCLVAGAQRGHVGQLEEWGVTTMGGLSALPDPLPAPERGSVATYERLRHQAGLQVQAREEERPVFELLAVAPDLGLCRLPEPSAGDVFLDFEGDPFAAEGGLEYLTGWIELDGSDGGAYTAVRAVSREQERQAFERLVDRLVERWEHDPGFHVYHYGSYEASTLKRLAGRYASRQDELDRLLRGKRLVDLLAVVRHALRAGVESYSLKQLEPLFGFVRQTELRAASRSLRDVAVALGRGRPEDLDAEIWQTVEGYNREDCLSTLRLRDWLERLRREVVERGEAIPRPEHGDGRREREDEDLTEAQRLSERLLDGVSADLGEQTKEERARWVLGHALEWHRRERNVKWWEFFRLADLPEEERYDEPRALAGLRFEERLPPKSSRQKVVVDRYVFPPQEFDARDKDVRLDADREFGRIEDANVLEGWVDIRKKKDTRDEHPTSIFVFTDLREGVLRKSVARLARSVDEHGIDGEGPYRAARDLLLREPPRGCAAPDESLRREGEPILDAARRLALELGEGVLPIQGPPGAGKTYTAARMIVALVKAGKKVGITAVSHKVIENLLDKAAEAAREAGVDLRCVQKVGNEAKAGEDGCVKRTPNNEDVGKALADGTANVAAGTAWLWARPELFASVDVLFVDEAGQMSLVNTLAAAQAARALVLVGDPQQLEQPIQASHPDGTAVAALEHLLAEHETIPPARGLFLEETWRLHPDICAFTSEQFYEGRLRPRPGLEAQCLRACGPLDGSGLWYQPVAHEGNRNRSQEEAAAIARIVDRLLADGCWVDAAGAEAPLGPDDILVVAPYNAQVALLRQRLPIRTVGTVDKFQGQQAPVVIYSMASSTPEDAPRGMEFLYSRNRLNVATSRARCAVILVANPRLMEPACRTPRQMRLANALCAFVERARALDLAT